MAAAGAAEAGSPAIGLRASKRENIPKIKKSFCSNAERFFCQKQKKSLRTVTVTFDSMKVALGKYRVFKNGSLGSS